MQHVTPDLLLWTSDIEICFPLARPLTSTSLAPATECVVSSALNSGRTQLAHKVARLHYSTVQYITVSTSTGYLGGHQKAVVARLLHDRLFSSQLTYSNSIYTSGRVKLNLTT